jgi:hypothetical protein
MRLARALCLCIAAWRVRSTLDPPEARKVTFLARPNMSTLMRPTSVHGRLMVDDECKVQIDEAVFLRLLLLA